MKSIFKCLSLLLVIAIASMSLADVKALTVGSSHYVWHNTSVSEASTLRNNNTGRDIVTYYVGYTANNSFIPVYCNNVNLQGVGWPNHPGYYLTVSNMAEPAVWRVITNGYPYRTPAELGVDNTYDAFTATKHAAYVVMGQVSINRYSAKNARGTKVISAMKRLINSSTGITGQASYQAPNFVVNKSAIKEEGNYAVMTITGSSSPIKADKIDVTTNGTVPAGTKITDVNGNAKTTFTNGETIKVMVPLASIDKKVAFNVKLSGRFATYPIYLGKSASASLQDYYMPGDKYEYASKQVAFNYTKPEPKERTCDDVDKDYQACSKDNSCSDKIKEEYAACHPKERTCDDVDKDYEACSKDNSCSDKIKEEYAACHPKERTCDDVDKDYEACSKDNSCSDKIKEEYAACHPKEEKTCDDINKEYEICSKDSSCTEELIEKYKACNPERTCDDIEKEYAICSEKGNCTDKLIQEHEACTPVEEEINPDTGSFNLVLAGLMVLGATGTGTYALRRRKFLEIGE